MKIALEYLALLGERSVEWVDVCTVDDLRTVFKEKRIVDYCRYSRCVATDDGRIEGKEIPAEALSEEDLEWASEQEFARSRYLLCVRTKV